MKLPYYKVQSGDYVRNALGERIKVLASYAAVGKASSSATIWSIEGYAVGKPTTRLRGNPDQLIEVERGQAA